MGCCCHDVASGGQLLLETDTCDEDLFKNALSITEPMPPFAADRVASDVNKTVAVGEEYRVTVTKDTGARHCNAGSELTSELTSELCRPWSDCLFSVVHHLLPVVRRSKHLDR